MSDEAAPPEETKPEAPKPTEEKQPEKKAKRPKFLVPVLLVLTVAAAIWGYRSWSFGRTHASTDDAQVASRIASAAPKIAGTITRVYVEDNVLVKKGDKIADVDPGTYQTVVDQDEANLALAIAQLNEARARVDLTSETGSAQIAQAEGGVGQSDAAIGGSQSEVDRARAAEATSRAQASAAESNIKGAQAGYQVAVAGVARARDAVREAQALAQNARAAVKSAQAAVVSARATETNARQNNERFQQLLKEGAVSAQNADQTLAALRVATAGREAAEENVRSAQATARQREAAVGTAQSGVAAAQAQVVQANTQVQSARVTAMAAHAAIAQATAAISTAQSNVAQAQGKAQQATGVLQQAKTANTQLEVSRIALQQADARVKQARAALARARLDLADTTVVAPIDGRVSRRTATVGQQVTPGTALAQIVPTDEMWVIANFKETQLRNVVKGQPVEIEVDALGGDPLKGHVESLSAGTGATFALLPPDNSTGNFTKVVQRVPVKIVFDKGQPLDRLAVGMSVAVTIDTERK